LLLIGCITIITSCQKFLDIDPPENKLTSTNIFKDDLAAIAVVAGIHTSLRDNNLFTGGQSITVLCALSADEIDLLPGFAEYQRYIYQNAITVNSAPFWLTTYSKLFTVNAALDGVSSSENLSYKVKTQLLGELKFVRAYLLFYLTNLHNLVPMPLSGDYKINSTLKSATMEQVYSQIVADLLESSSLLSEDYLNGTLTSNVSNRLRPVKAAAYALLARTYLYQRNWEKAEEYSTKVINNSRYKMVDAPEVFKDNSEETIWQLQSNRDGNTFDADFFVINEQPNDENPVVVSKSLLDAFSTNDKRLENWIGKIEYQGETYYFPYKYKLKSFETSANEDLIMLRLGEQYLIRAEARANLGNINGSKDDLDRVLLRAGLDETNSTDQNGLLKEIIQQRRLELFCENGHRWFDIRRTGQMDQVMNEAEKIKGGVWQSYKQFFNVPFSEIEKNRNLSQNPGYQ